MRREAGACAALLLAGAACVPDFAPLERLPRGDAGGARGAAPGEPDEAGGDGEGDADSGDTAVLTPRDPARSACDLTGGWLVTERMLLNALGAKQEVAQWRFIELAQEGDAVVVEKSLACGDTVRGLPPMVITMESSKMWDALLKRGTMAGRKGTARAVPGGCEVAFERAVEVRGATESAYADLELPLPSPSEPASGDRPGWEDWDEDGKPGVTVRVSGTLSGTLYFASRSWTEWAGTVDPSLGTFKLPMKWQQDRSPLGVEGSPLLTLQGGAPDPDPDAHYAEFAFVSAAELGSNDAARCARVRALAPTLTPGR